MGQEEKELEDQRDGNYDSAAKAKLQVAIDFMAKLDMAVVVSQSQGEVDAFKKKGIDIAPHRLRMMKEDLDTKFKDPADRLEDDRSLTTAGEPGVALENLCEQLFDHSAVVPTEVVQELATLGRAMGLMETYWTRLQQE